MNTNLGFWPVFEGKYERIFGLFQEYFNRTELRCVHLCQFHPFEQCIRRYSIRSRIDLFSLLVWTVVTWNVAICSAAILLYSTETRMKRRTKKKSHQTHTESLKFQLFIENHGRFIITNCFYGAIKIHFYHKQSRKEKRKKNRSNFFETIIRFPFGIWPRYQTECANRIGSGA